MAWIEKHRNAHGDRSALWLRLPGESRCPMLYGVLADRNFLHTRYCGSGKQEDRV